MCEHVLDLVPRSVVDAALYEVLVLETQKMHSLTLVLQNTQQQYMTLRGVPRAAQIWALRVNSQAVQPVRGKSKEQAVQPVHGKNEKSAKSSEDSDVLMVPLLVGARQATTSSHDGDDHLAMKTSVELSWMTEHRPLGVNGTMTLSPPRLDMPISSLQVDVQFPEPLSTKFTNGNSETLTMKNVVAFTKPTPYGVNYQTDRKLVKKGHRFASGAAKGAKMSVKTEVPQGGKHYRFEKILVLHDGGSLAVEYWPAPEKTQPTLMDQVLDVAGEVGHSVRESFRSLVGRR